MKTLYFCMLATTMGMCAYAQPTLTAAANNPIVGQIDSAYLLDTVGISPGPSGAGVTWNFSSVTVTDVDVAWYVPCLSTPWCDSFPGTNIALKETSSAWSLTDTVYEYYVTDSFHLGSLGAVWSAGVCNHGYQNILHYPISYGGVYVDTTYTTSGIGGISDTTIELDSLLADGWGTLITPAGTFTNVLRLHHKIHDTNRSAGVAISYRYSEAYYWYSAAYHSLLMGIQIDYNPPGGMPAYDMIAAYIKETISTASINDDQSNNVAIKTYPNPTTDILNITFSIPDITGASLILSDITGRSVKAITDLSQGANNITIGTTELSAGLYTLRLQSPNGITTQKITIIK